MGKIKIVLDADVVIDFKDANRLAELPRILPGYDFVILDIVLNKELGKWREYNKLEICNSCPLYAECIKPTYCKEMGKCDEFTKERLINQGSTEQEA